MHRADALFLRHVDEGTGVDDEHIGQLGLRRHGHASLLEVTDHDFGVDEVFGAAEGDETDFDHNRKGGAEDTGFCPT